MINQQDVTNASNLLEEEFEEFTHMVDDLIVPGVTLLAADPKSGKSYLMLYLSYCVATGQPAFGNKRAVKQGKVLYMALEDSNRRLQKRLQEIRKKDVLASVRLPEGLDIFTRGKLAMEGRFESLTKIIEENDYDMVVIDILQNIRKKGESMTYNKEYELLKNLGDVAHSTDTAIVLVHHTKKGNSSNKMQKISGTQGLSGAADNLIVMERQGNDSILDLHVKGRDIEEHQFWLEFGTDEAFYKQLNDPPTSRSTQAKMDKAWELSQDGLTQGDIAKMLGYKQPYICKLLKAKLQQLKDQESNEE